MNWKEKAIQLLNDSLHPVPTELNEIDWKVGLSTKTERLAQHLCAFANLKGGGVLVFGVDNDGTAVSFPKIEIDKTVQLLGNIANNNLATPIHIEHDVLEYEGASLLFIYIPEQDERPIHLRGKDIYDSYIRSAGQTVKMSRSQVKAMIAESRGIKFEQVPALSNLSGDQVLSLLNYRKYFELIDKTVPNTADAILNRLVEQSFCRLEEGGWVITNLGAILFASNLKNFPTLMGREVVVRKYVGTNNRQQVFEHHGHLGYAVGFEGLTDYVMGQTSSESIETLREPIPTYPRIAIREFIANALVHQDFAIEGLPISIEIYSNRLAITNPGAPLNDVNRLIDLPPHSRNEVLAQALFHLGICERRGSGVDRAIEAIETMGLPPAKFTRSDQHTQVIIYPKKELKDMTKQEKIRACYQHACLLHEDNQAINNQSLRERFGLDKSKSSVASRILLDTLEAGLIKVANNDITSRKYATYVPYYA
jgi:predicted HTH transcriptional regulator